MKARAEVRTIILGEAREPKELEPQLESFLLLEDRHDVPKPFRLLDSFDGSIRRSGLALIETGGRLLLVGGSHGPLSLDIQAQPKHVSDLPDGPLKAALGRVSPLRCLLPSAEGTASCQDFSVLDDEGKTVARLSFVTLRGRGPQGATIATVHGLRGYGAAFETISSRVASIHRLPAAAADLYRLLGAEESRFDLGSRAALPPDMPAFEVTNRMVRDCLDAARRTEAGIVADWDTEFLHDYRVAFRRARSVVSLFRGVYSDPVQQDLRQTMRELMARTGALRDLDVHLLDRDAYFAVLPNELHEGLGLLFDRLTRTRAQEQRRLAKWFRSPAYSEAITALAHRFEEPVRVETGPNGSRPVEDMLQELLRQRWRSTRAAARRIGTASPDEAVHDLRIRCKKLRYLLEFAAPVLGAAAVRPLIRPLKALQEELGTFNDYTVQSASLQKLLPPRAPERSTDLAIAKSIGALTAILHQRKAAQRRRVDKSLAFFTQGTVHRRYARCIDTWEKRS
jgi:CHAD domain-containing protein